MVGSGAVRSVDPRWSAATFSPSALNYAVDPRHASAHTAPSQHPPVAPPAGLLDGVGPHWTRQRQAAEHSHTPTSLPLPECRRITGSSEFAAAKTDACAEF